MIISLKLLGIFEMAFISQYNYTKKIKIL